MQQASASHITGPDFELLKACFSAWFNMVCGDRTQVFMHTWQALYPLSYVASPNVPV